MSARRLPPRTPALLAGLLMLALVPGALAAPARAVPQADFEAANRLYEEGRFAEAARAYQRLVQSGLTSPALYFNLGNAFFKSSQIGRAILAYRQAQRITPRDPDVRANLQFARNQVQGPTLPVGRWQRWLGRLSLDEWTVLAAAAGWALFLLLALLQWRPPLKSSLRTAVLGVGALAVLLAVCLGGAFYQNRSVRIAVVVNPEAVVHAGWFAESNQAFTVHDGAELRVLDQHDQWLQVTSGPLRLGWLHGDEVVLE